MQENRLHSMRVRTGKSTCSCSRESHPSVCYQALAGSISIRGTSARFGVLNHIIYIVLRAFSQKCES